MANLGEILVCYHECPPMTWHSSNPKYQMMLTMIGAKLSQKLPENIKPEAFKFKEQLIWIAVVLLALYLFVSFILKPFLCCIF